jgi:hypothetical protein
VPVELEVKVCALAADTPRVANMATDDKTLFLVMDIFIIRLRFLAFQPIPPIEEEDRCKVDSAPCGQVFNIERRTGLLLLLAYLVTDK